MSEIVVKEIIRPFMGAVLPGIKKEADKNVGFYIVGGLGIAGILGVVGIMINALSQNNDDSIEENDVSDEVESLEVE